MENIKHQITSLSHINLRACFLHKVQQLFELIWVLESIQIGFFSKYFINFDVLTLIVFHCLFLNKLNKLQIWLGRGRLNSNIILSIFQFKKDKVGALDVELKVKIAVMSWKLIFRKFLAGSSDQFEDLRLDFFVEGYGAFLSILSILNV